MCHSIFLIDSTSTSNTIINPSILPKGRTNQQYEIDIFIQRQETCDLLFTFSKVSLVDFYNDTTQKLGQFILHIIKYLTITQLTSNIHFKSVKFSLNLVKYEKQYSPLGEAMISVTSRLQCHKIFP